jgi:hypothetical protein
LIQRTLKAILEPGRAPWNGAGWAAGAAGRGVDEAWGALTELP